MAFDKLYIAIYITVHENNIYVFKKALLKMVNKLNSGMLHFLYYDRTTGCG